MRVLVKIATWLAIAYLSSAFLLVACEQALLRLHDHDGPVQGPGTDVWLRTEDGVRIHARYYERGPSLPTLLYFHGGAGTLASRSDRLELFSNLGANLLAVEYRGYGLSAGTSSEAGFESDASAAYAWLHERTSADKIVPYGESMGGGVATWTAVNRPIGGLILLSTSTSTPRLFARFMPWLPTSLLVRTQLDNLSRMPQIAVPKLFIHSRTDEVVPFDMAQVLEAAAPAPKRHLWLDGIGHDETFYRARPEATEAIRTFLRDLHAQ